jgi:hypothetical protein
MLRIFNQLSDKYKDFYLLLGCSLLLFVTRIISFREFSLDPDELEWLYDVRKCLIDPRPFVGFDAHTTGPFAIYLLAMLKFVTGFSTLYQLRLVSFFFFIVPSMVLVSSILPKKSRTIGLLAFTVLLCAKNFRDFGNFYDGIFSYNTEYQILVYTSILFWLLRTQKKGMGLIILFAFILFSLPFVKIQSIFITAFFGLYFSVNLFLKRHYKELQIFILSYLVFNLAWLFFLYYSNIWPNFITNYLEKNIQYLSDSTFEQSQINPINFFIRTHQYYQFAYIFIVFFVLTTFLNLRKYKIQRFSDLFNHQITQSSLLLIASVITIIISKNDFGHYYIYLFLPLSIFIADLFSLISTDLESKNILQSLKIIFIATLLSNFNFDYLGKSIGFVYGKFTKSNENKYDMGKPLLSLANPELIHYLQKNKPKNASILVIGWTQAQAIYYLLRDDYRPTYRSSQFFDYRDTFEKNDSIRFKQYEVDLLEDIKKNPPVFIVDTWNLINITKKTQMMQYVHQNYHLVSEFKENKLLKKIEK